MKFLSVSSEKSKGSAFSRFKRFFLKRRWLLILVLKIIKWFAEKDE